MRNIKLKKVKAGPTVQRMAVTAANAARLIGLSSRTVRRLITKGELPASLFGKRWVVRIRDIEQLLDDRRVEKRN